MAAPSKTYLELSEDGGSHKFYEVIVKGKKVSIRYGRIGDEGQSSEEVHPSEAAARAFADRKIAEKTRKGYAPAIEGARAARPVSRRARPATARTSRSKTKERAPLLWTFRPSDEGSLGIFIDRTSCWMGNNEGAVYALDHGGRAIASFKLPAPDGSWVREIALEWGVLGALECKRARETL